jgi:hypothetical protein
MEPVKRQAWLFTRSDESIRITRNMRGMVVFVCGPHATRHTYTFNDATSLNDFLGSYLNRLEAEGWGLHATADRRHRHEAFPPAINRRGDRTASSVQAASRSDATSANRSGRRALIPFRQKPKPRRGR